MTAVEALEKALEILDWVSMTRYEREAVADDLKAIEETLDELKKVGHD